MVEAVKGAVVKAEADRVAAAAAVAIDPDLALAAIAFAPTAGTKSRM